MEGAEDIYHINDLGIGRILAEIKKDTQQEIVKKTFYSASDVRGRKISETLLETLKAFFDNNLSISRAARAIYIHSNTLLYRLRRVKEITGLDPKKFDDAVQLSIALKMRMYQGSNLI